MADPSLSRVALSNGQPTLWWRGTAGVALGLCALVATGLGLWAYTVTRPGTSKQGDLAHSQPAIDAVTRILTAGKPTIIEFGANSCVACREMKPVLHALAQDQRIAVADIDILKERDYISRYQIRLMPTQVFYDANGKEIGRNMGKISGEEVLSRLGVSQPKAAL